MRTGNKEGNGAMSTNWNNPDIPEPIVADSEVAADAMVIIEVNGVNVAVSFDSSAEAQAFVYAYANAHKVVGFVKKTPPSDHDSDDYFTMPVDEALSAAAESVKIIITETSAYDGSRLPNFLQHQVLELAQVVSFLGALVAAQTKKETKRGRK